MVISKGKCLIVDGDKELEVIAPWVLVSEVGAKRAIYAETETVMASYHITNETDIKKIEADIIEPEGLKITNNPLEAIK